MKKNNQPTSNSNNIVGLIKEVLAEQIGVEPEDIHDEDSFKDDLHMSPVDLTDFINALQDKGIDTSKIDLVQISTVENLIELLSFEETI